MSLIQLLTSPFFTGVSAFYKISTEDELDKNDYELIQNNAFSPEKNKNDQYNKKRIGFASLFAFISYLFLFLPIMLLEVIHFCPVLFEYYYYKNMSTPDLIIYLLIFNIPKLIFLLMKIRTDITDETELIAKHSKEELSNRMNQTDYILKDKGEFHVLDLAYVLLQTGYIDTGMLNLIKGLLLLVVLGIVYVLLFIVLPLIPAVLYCILFPMVGGVTVIDYAFKQTHYIEQNYDYTQEQQTLHMKTTLDYYYKTVARNVSVLMRKNIFLLWSYLIIAYGSMGRMFFHENGIGEGTLIMLIATWTISMYLIILPFIAPQIARCLLVIIVKNAEIRKTIFMVDVDATEASAVANVFGSTLNIVSRFIMCPCFVNDTVWDNIAEEVIQWHVHESRLMLSQITYDDKSRTFKIPNKPILNQKISPTESLTSVVDETGNSFLHFIAKHGLLELLSKHINKCDINGKNHQDQTPYMLALIYDNPNCARQLREDYKCDFDDELITMCNWTNLREYSQSNPINSCFTNNIFKCFGNSTVGGNCRLIQGLFYYECKLYLDENTIDDKTKFAIGFGRDVHKHYDFSTKIDHVLCPLYKKELLSVLDVNENFVIIGALIDIENKHIQIYLDGEFYFEFYFVSKRPIDYYVPICATEGFDEKALTMEIYLCDSNLNFKPTNMGEINKIEILDLYQQMFTY
eukprot:534541_1